VQEFIKRLESLLRNLQNLGRIMAKYHINLNGQPASCRASERSCPRGGVDEHFASKEAAYASIAEDHEGTFLNSTKREDTVSTEIRSAEEFYGGRFVTPHSIELEPGVATAIEDLREVGNPLIVGGAVRDSFEGHNNKDIDIEVHGATVDGIIELLRKKGYHVDEVGKKFGVLKASKNGAVTDLDVSVPRKENRTGAGHRNFEVELDESMTVSEAAERRDFTFNSVMYDPQREMLIDPAGGRADFDNKTMRHVSEKFSEDPLRVLRGFQFAGRFGMTYAPETAALCKELRSEYSDLSIERVREEWTKYFTKSTHPEMGVTALQESGWDDTIPGLQPSISAAQDDLKNLPKVPKDDRAVVGAALIGRKYETDTQPLLDAVLVDNDSRRKAKVLMASDSSALADSAYNRKMFALEASRKKMSFELYENYAIATNDSKGIEAARLAREDGVFDKPEKPLADGNDVLALTDRKSGRWLGEVMNTLLEKQYHGELKSKDEALRLAKKLITE
jgi:tRNA nucleotidyltransferase/poly(A) polymerase